MKKYCKKLIISGFALLTLSCSRNNSPSNSSTQNSNNKISSTTANTITASSSGKNPTTGNQVTSGSSNTDKGITEVEINNSVKTLNSLKFNKDMYDFSKPQNVDALSEREGIIDQLKTDSSVLQREDVKAALINLLNNEAKYSREYYENTHKGLGEDYGEYEGELEILVYKYMDKRSLKTMVVVLGDDDGFLTTYWKESSQLVLQRIKNPVDDLNILYQIAALGKAQKEKNYTLDPETIKLFKEFAFNELKSTKSYIRKPAAEALQYVATKNDKKIIEELKTVEKSDPKRYGAPIFNERLKKMELYPVREAAQRALEYIEKQ